MMYVPKPYDTKNIILSDQLNNLTEQLAKNTHENWAAGRMKEGWVYGVERNDQLKQHPSLVPYENLSESEKDYDRRTAMETLKVMVLLGYDIVKDKQM